jgi:predicted nucleic acid-binding protein
MKIVVDTNILFSAILNSHSRIGQIILHPSRKHKFYSVRFLQKEIQSHFDKIKKITKLSDEELHELIEILYARFHFISDDLIPVEVITKADELTKSVDFDDILFVALTLHLNCKLWTGDVTLMNALKKQGFNKFISTGELIERHRK